MKPMNTILSACAVLALAAFVACGGGGGGSSQPASVLVSVSPATATVVMGGTQTFTATVTGNSNTAVTWSVQEGASGGAIDASGHYTAPATVGTYHVVATSAADSTKSGFATVTVPAVSVSLLPASANLLTGATQTFTATVSGSANTAVTWSVQEGASGGTVSAAGLYTAPATAGTYHVVATSVADTSKSATATVTVAVPVVAVTISPATASVQTGGTQTFTTTVTGTLNTAVTWSVQEGAAGGTVSAGVYTAPATAGTYHVVATSVADASKSATATVTVTAPPATSLGYTDPAGGTYRLVKNAASSGSHLVLDLVGPTTGTGMGVSITLTGDAHTTWVDVPAGGTTAVLVQNGTQFSLGTGTAILKAKAATTVLQATVAQKAPTAAASLNGVLLQVALDLKAGQNLPQGTSLTLSADGTKCQLLDGTGTISTIAVSVGTLTAQ